MNTPATSASALLEAIVEMVTDRVYERIASDLGDAPNQPRETLLTVSEACTFLNISRSYLYTLIDQGLPCVTVGRLRRFNPPELLVWFHEKQETSE